MNQQEGRVLLDKEVLNRYVGNFDVEKEVDVPDFVMEMKGTAYIVVKGASLDDHIKARELSKAPVILLSTILNKIVKGEEVDVDSIRDEIYSGKQLHPSTNFELQIFEQCVIKPKFEMAEVIRISEVIPEFVNRVVTIALGITSNGDRDGYRETS